MRVRLVPVSRFAWEAAIPYSTGLAGELGRTLISPFLDGSGAVRPSVGTAPAVVYSGSAVTFSFFPSCGFASDTLATPTSATVMVASNITTRLISYPFCQPGFTIAPFVPTVNG